MLRIIKSYWTGVKRLSGLRVSLLWLTPGRVMACLSLLGLAGLSVIAGAAVMYFEVPPFSFFNAAFGGARAWYQRGLADPLPSAGPGGMARAGVWRDHPPGTFDGFTLYTTTQGPRAKLINMRGDVVHEWELPFRKAWATPPHVRDPLPDQQIHWFRAHLYPNGDLLAVYHAEGDTPFGYGLVKVDKDSRLQWAYAGNTHHDIDVDEDGAIYTLGQKIDRKPPPGLDELPGPLITDSLVVLAPDGRERESIPLLEAFRDSSYAQLFLAALDLAPARGPAASRDSKGDLVHANSVKVLTRNLAPKFPLFRPGQVLISFRTPNLLAVVDRGTRTVVWAARGIWQAQHDAEFLQNGHILLYDNVGSNHGSRVVEYDPQTQAVTWIYQNENSDPFRAASRGMKQRLPNGNTLLTDPDHWLLLEVTPTKDLVWKACCGGIVTGARRYGPDELTFLKGEAHARP
jgi:hypothetical protein